MAKNLQYECVIITEEGSIFLHYRKTDTETGRTDAHDTGFPPGCDIDSFAASVNETHARDGLSLLTTEDVNRVKTLAPVLWTPEVVAAWEAAQRQ